MGQLSRYRITLPNRKVTQDTIPVYREVKVEVPEVYLEPTVTEITRSNSVPGVKDYLVHNISEYKREDTSIRLLPSADISLDVLLKPIDTSTLIRL